MQRQKLEHAWVTGTTPIHHQRSDDRADSKSSPPDSPSLCYPAKKKRGSHISIVRSDCQRRRPSSSRRPPPPPDAVGGRRGATDHSSARAFGRGRGRGSAYRPSAGGSICAGGPQCTCACTCSRTPPKDSDIHIYFPPTVTLQTLSCSVLSFLLSWSKRGVRAFVWRLSITSGHWCIPQSNLLTTLRAHMCFPLRQEAKEHIIQPVTIQPLPQQWVHSLLVPLGERAAFWA